MWPVAWLELVSVGEAKKVSLEVGERFPFTHFLGTNPIAINGTPGFPSNLPLSDGDLISPVEGLVFRFGDGQPSAAP